MADTIQWSPYLEKMREELNQLTLKEIRHVEGHAIMPAQEFKTSQVHGGLSAYSVEKIEKIAIGTFYLNETIHYGFCTIIPDDSHNMPLFISLWEEGEREITFLVDLMPTVDSLIDEEYRKKYLESVQPLWERYASLPGICPVESDVVRSLCSIIYTAARVPIDKEGMRLAVLAPHPEYLKNYISFVQEATEVEDRAKRKEVERKKKALRRTLRESFAHEILKKTVAKTVGDNLLELMRIVLF